MTTVSRTVLGRFRCTWRNACALKQLQRILVSSLMSCGYRIVRTEWSQRFPISRGTHSFSDWENSWPWWPLCTHYTVIRWENSGKLSVPRAVFAHLLVLPIRFHILYNNIIVSWLSACKWTILFATGRTQYLWASYMVYNITILGYVYIILTFIVKIVCIGGKALRGVPIISIFDFLLNAYISFMTYNTAYVNYALFLKRSNNCSYYFQK